MLGKNILHKSLSLLAVLAVWCVSSSVAFAMPNNTTGEITVSGQVTVNGQAVVSNQTIVSGNTISTAAGSTATVNLGKNGRVELMENTSITLNFSDTNITGVLTSGMVQTSNAPGIATTISTRNATILGDVSQANTFSVNVGCSDDVKCTQTLVQTTSGLVTLRNGSTDKQIAAGTDAVAGNPSQTGCQPCFRPNSAPPLKLAGIGAGALAAILSGIGAAVVAAVLLSDNGNTDVSSGGVIVSPIR